ncbi:MAG: CDP-4-keto-6-deoxy-D-glucose-3-dehydrase [Nitrospinae bacterium CG11_big_fil_rev_8_21_14_0_20_56_8]|nr:MAG: CDP-4-keto-6-deoxy-D-glucose-3-dehydrase [Nitrospinae bacterium CG11_big_fil_rev_8_21_14_0_20_56_8]
MENNITREDLDAVIEFLQGNPILTQSRNVREFEQEWADWLGVKYSVFVNSGASANFITLGVLKQISGTGEVIVPALTWISDIASVLQHGFTPVFVDIDPRTLCMKTEDILGKLSDRTRAVFLTHAQGFNGLTDPLLKTLERKGIPLIEDVCESHGATFKGRKLGTYGWVSNFSYYFAHHMSTIEGGMVCTNDEKLYQLCRMFRSHGMVREATDEKLKQSYIENDPELNPEFIFAYPAFNMRNTEIGAVIGRKQLKRLDGNNLKRFRNNELFLKHLDPEKYRTDFELEGSCNYAFNLVMKKPDARFCGQVMDRLKACRVEFRRGSAGGGNQLRQPYLKGIVPPGEFKKFPETEHIHFFGFYIGNYPDLQESKILELCRLLNGVPV